MKKNAKRFLLLLIVCLLVWTVFPRPFAWIIPQRMVNVSGERPEICAETEFTASLSFGIDQEVLDAFYDLHSEKASGSWPIPSPSCLSSTSPGSRSR